MCGSGSDSWTPKCDNHRMEWHDAAAQNRRAWEEIATQRSAAYPDSLIPAKFFSNGGTILDERVVAAVGDPAGIRLLHLMCATGEETLSWAVLRAAPTGVDISQINIDLATEKAAAAGLPARFVCADVGELPAELRAADFDVVYTAIGVLVWIPDLSRWAAAIAKALRSGGRFVLLDEHPIAMAMWGEDGRVQVVDDYFGRDTPTTGTGWGHFPGGEDAIEPTHQFNWPLGDILNALTDAGLAIRRVDEYPTRSGWRFGDAMDDARKLPGELLIVAVKTRS